MFNFFVQMKLGNFADLYSKQLRNQFKNSDKIPGNFFRKPGKVMEFCQSEKAGTPNLLILEM